MDGHHHLTSSHKKKEAERGEQRREGRLQTHTEQIDEKRHSPSALLVCDTLADNSQSVHSVAGGWYLLSHSLLWQALLYSLAPVPVTFYPPLRSSSLFSTERFFLFSRMSHAIGSHLLRVRSRAVRQATTMSGTRMSLSSFRIIHYPMFFFFLSRFKRILKYFRLCFNCSLLHYFWFDSWSSLNLFCVSEHVMFDFHVINTSERYYISSLVIILTQTGIWFCIYGYLHRLYTLKCV